MMNEILDIVNEQDEVISSKLRSDVYAEGLTNFRVVNAFLQNNLGQLWIPRRSSSKRIFPLCLDTSMGGHVSSGESYFDAFKRELIEELNLNVDSLSYKELGTLNPHQHKMSAFMKVYLIYTNEIPDYNKNDFIEYYWLYPQEVLALLENGDKSKDDLPKLIRHLFLY